MGPAAASAIFLDVVKEIAAVTETHASGQSLPDRSSGDLGEARVALDEQPTSRSDLDCFMKGIPELLAIERHEQRTLSRRRKAIDAFRYIRSARRGHASDAEQ